MDDNLHVTHVLHSLERIEVRLEKLSESDVNHAHEIQSIKTQLHNSIVDLNNRLQPIEEIVRYLSVGSRFLRWGIGAVIAIGGFLSALAIFKDKLW